MAKGFLYLVAIIDWYSRKVLAWRLSNALDSHFCVEALEEAVGRYGCPEIFKRYHQRVCKKVKAMYPFCCNQENRAGRPEKKGAHRHAEAKH